MSRNNKKSTADILDSLITDTEEITLDGVTVRKDIDNDKLIKVTSITYGFLIYKSKTTGLPFRWANRGATISMKFSELSEMYNSNPAFLTTPLVIVNDPDVVDYFGLGEIYANTPTIEKLEELFKQSQDEINKEIDRYLKAKMRDVLISTIRTMYETKRLTDINILTFLENKLMYWFTLNK